MRINNRGNILLISFSVILVLSIFGAALMLISIAESNMARRQRITAIAFHIAEAGIDRAIYDLQKDFINDLSSPSWADGDINGYSVGPNTTNFYNIGYTDNLLNEGSYSVELRNVVGSGEAIWVRSTGNFEGLTQTIQIYAIIENISPWDNAIFAGTGAAGAMINGNVDVRGSVHILGTGLESTDYAVDLGGTAELIGNNYADLSANLRSKVPALPTTVFNGETVETLNAELRVKRGIVGLSGAATVGQPNVSGNGVKETIDGSYVTDGFGGTAAEANVHSDNGWSNGYDLGDTVTFPSLSDPYAGHPTFQAYFMDGALVISDAASLNQLANITPNSNFNFTDGTNSISMNGNGNLTISGKVYVNGGNLNMNKAGQNKTITYTGKGTVFVTGNSNINLNLVTGGNDSFPTNIIGIMTPNEIGFNEANIDVMGLFYAEDTITIQKQTDLVGTIVSNYFDMGTNVPTIFQVPSTINNLPPGMIGQDPIWYMKIVLWQKL